MKALPANTMHDYWTVLWIAIVAQAIMLALHIDIGILNLITNFYIVVGLLGIIWLSLKKFFFWITEEAK